MADTPQKENGFTPIANEIMEALMKVNLSAYESRVLWFLFRKTYGWSKKTDWITLSQFSDCIGLDRRLIHRAIKGLSSKKMIVIYKDDTFKIRYGFQKDYKKWKLSSKKMTVINRDERVSSKEMTGLSSIQIPTKESITKETIQKKKDIYEHFEKFWLAYPKKKNKGTAEKAFKKINPSKKLLETILLKIEQAKLSKDWIKESGQYIPYPATWLNAMGWEDEYNTNPLDGVLSDKGQATVRNLQSWMQDKEEEEQVNERQG